MIVTFKDKQYYVTSWEEYCQMLYWAGEPELENLTKDFISDDVAEINDLKYEIGNYETTVDGYNSALVTVYNLAEDLQKYVKDTKRLDRDKIVELLEEIMHETGI